MAESRIPFGSGLTECNTKTFKGEAALKSSIVYKILALVLIITALAFGISMWVMISKTRIEINETSKREVQYLAGKQAQTVQAELDMALDAARTIAGMIEPALNGQGERLSREQVMNMLKGVVQSQPELLAAYVCFEPNAFDGKDAEYVDKPGHDATGRFIPYWNQIGGQLRLDPLVDYDIEGAGDYYLLAKKNNREEIIEPYLYEGALITSLIAPIQINDKFVGIAGIDLDLYHISEMVGKLKLYDNGYGALVSNKGAYAAHPNPLLIGNASVGSFDLAGIKDAINASPVYKEKATTENMAGLEQLAANRAKSEDSYRRLADEITAGREGYDVFTDSLNGKNSLLYYVPINVGSAKTPWSFMISAPEEEIFASVKRISNYGIIIAGVFIVLLAAVFIPFMLRLLRPLKQLDGALASLAEGNLGIKAKGAERKDEIGGLAHSFNSMIDRLRQVVGSLQSEAGQLAGSSDTLVANSQQTAASANQTAATMSEMAATIQQISRNSQDMAAQARQSSQMSEDGRRQITQVKEQMAQIASGFDDVKEAINGLINRSNKIGQITETITGIADQTNLLALNAAIEAARAGEQGRGFAVVAEEVRKLAEESAGAAGEIQKLIDEVHSSAALAEKAVHAGSGGIDSGGRVIEEAGEVFTLIVNSIQSLAAQVGGIATATVQLNAGIENVAAGSEEQTAAMQEVSSAAEILKAMAKKLKEMSEQFQL
jgi:methyl-accepting chemotaxis protein